MAPPRINSILRYVRVKMKTGYMKEKPWEYDYIRRFPPIANINAPDHYTVRKMEIPYYHLYEKIVTKNPKYLDETVYPIYQSNEPEALSIAKQQFLYMEKGFNETEALKKATYEINQKENQAYLSIQKMIDEIKSVGPDHFIERHYGHNPTVMKQYNKLKELLPYDAYDTLPENLQVEIDHFIQTYLFYWNEIQRERRMKDFLFQQKYNYFLQTLFPLNETGIKSLQAWLHPIIKKKYFKEIHLNMKKHYPKRKFYLEDYLFFYELLLQESNYEIAWALDQRDLFITWLNNTCLYRSFDGKPDSIYDIQFIRAFKDRMKAYLFPMTIFPSRKNALPKDLNLQKLKEICYHHNIGYRRDPFSGFATLSAGESYTETEADAEIQAKERERLSEDDLRTSNIVVTKSNKIYVRRFYELGKYLFPRDFFCTNIAFDNEKLTAILADKEEKKLLLEEMKANNIDITLVDEIYDQLDEYLKYQNALNQPELDIPIQDLDDRNVLDSFLNVAWEENEKLKKSFNHPNDTNDDSNERATTIEQVAAAATATAGNKMDSLDTLLSSSSPTVPKEEELDEKELKELEEFEEMLLKEYKGLSELLIKVDLTHEKLEEIVIKHNDNGNLPSDFLEQFQDFPDFINLLKMEGKLIYHRETFENTILKDISEDELAKEEEEEELEEEKKKNNNNKNEGKYVDERTKRFDESYRIAKDIITSGKVESLTDQLEQALLLKDKKTSNEVEQERRFEVEIEGDEGSDDEDDDRVVDLHVEFLNKLQNFLENYQKPEKPSNWNDLLKKYSFHPETELEKERLDVFLKAVNISLNDLFHEKELKQLEKRRNEWLLASHNKLRQAYQNREAIRKAQLWTNRGWDVAETDLEPQQLKSWQELSRLAAPVTVDYFKKGNKDVY